MSSDIEHIEQHDAYAIAELRSARARRADLVIADLALSAASTRQLALSAQLGTLERELESTRAEVAQLQLQLAQSRQLPAPARSVRIVRRLLAALQGLWRRAARGADGFGG